jgi:hypothetical protein
VRTVAVGTGLWAVAFCVLVVFRDQLADEGLGWFLWTCLAGLGMGLLGLEYTRKRRDAIARARLQEEADRLDLDSEPLAESKPEPAQPQPEPRPAQRRPELEPVLSPPEPRPVPTRPEPEPVPTRPEPEPEPVPTQREPEPPRWEPPPEPRQTSRPSELALPPLLDVGPPVPAPPPASRRARRPRDVDPVEPDDDELLLPMAKDLRGPTGGRRARHIEPTDDDGELLDSDDLYRGRRARRP